MKFKINIPLIFALIKKETIQKYNNSILGPAWNIILPATNIFIYYLIFEVGFKVKQENEIPFIIWFLSGYLPFIFFQNCTTSISTIFTEYRFLIRKIKFPFKEILISRLLTNTVTFVLFCSLFLCYVTYQYSGAFPNIYFLLITYLYVLLLSIFIGSIVSIAALQFSDLTYSLPVIFQVLFWTTPIVWNMSIVPVDYISSLSINPLFQIIDLFRLGLFGDSNYQAVSKNIEVIFLATGTGVIFGTLFINRFIKKSDLL